MADGRAGGPDGPVGGRNRLIRTNGSAPTRRRAGRPPGIDSDETRLRILDVALDAFAEGGFGGTATRAIAERADVTSATVYHHFSSKRALYLQAYRHALDVTYAAYADAVRDTESLVEDLTMILETSLDIMRERPAITKLCLRAQSDLSGAELRAPDLTESPTRLLAEIIARATARGDLAPADGVLVERLVAVFLWGLSIVGFDDEQARRECVDAIERVVSSTLIASPPARPEGRGGALTGPGAVRGGGVDNATARPLS